MKAKYVSVYEDVNGEEYEVKTDCEYNPETKDVTNLNIVQVDSVDEFLNEYLLLPDGTELDMGEYTIDGEEN